MAIATASDPSAATLTFGLAAQTVYFRLLLSSPEQSREVQISVRHIPGGNVNIADIGGLMPTYIRGEAFFATYADFVNLKDNATGQAATLTYSEGTYPVYLTKISRRRVPNNLGHMTATVEFLVNL